MRSTNRYTHIIKDITNKFGFNIIDSENIIYFSGFIYDEIYPLNTHVESYLECDLIRLKNNDLYGIYDAWNMVSILSLEYKFIDIFHFYGNFCYLCQLENNKFILKTSGSDNTNTEYDDLMYIGEYQNKYLFMGKINNVISIFELYSKTNIINDSKYIFEYYGVNNFIVLKIIKNNETDPDIFDIYSNTGTLLYSSVSDYYFLNIS
jgi:hypothetical protein